MSKGIICLDLKLTTSIEENEKNIIMLDIEKGRQM
jgi:hypothetical protein